MIPDSVRGDPLLWHLASTLVRSEEERYYKCVFYQNRWVTKRPLDKYLPLQWRHNGRDGASNHQPHDCLLSCLFGCRSRKTSKLHITGLCAGNSQGTGEFPAQMASNAESVSIWWRHYVQTDSCVEMIKIPCIFVKVYNSEIYCRTWVFIILIVGYTLSNYCK